MRGVAFTLILAVVLLPAVAPSGSGLYALRQLVAAWPGNAVGATYYVSAQGDDANSGLSPGEAWATVGRVSREDFAPGSRILLEGGQRFEGTLVLSDQDCRGGSAAAPTAVGSYGSGRATVAAGDGFGIYIQNCDYVEISNLVLQGSGTGNFGSGVEIVNMLPGDVLLDWVTIDGLDISGFYYGIQVTATNGLSGFTNLRITNNEIHRNVHVGIETLWEDFDADATGWPFVKVSVAHNRVYETLGDPARRSGHTGSGIALGSVLDATVEHNVAFSNGVGNSSRGFGPVGIWAWDCKRTVIQFNESFDNRSNSAVDGGGFDLDGGCQDAIMQYNFAHDNDGAGFMAGQYAGARTMRDITVRYNLSVNDARRNRYGAITLFTAPESTLERVFVYQNTVHVSPGRGGASAFGVTTWFPGLETVWVVNNSFITGGGVPFIDIVQKGDDIYFWGNNYDSSGDAFVIKYEGRTYTSLPAWREATEQEVGRYFADVGSAVPAGVVQPGGSTAADYRLREDSGLVDAGLDLSRGFGFVTEGRDFFGNPAPARGAYDVGMYELPAAVTATATPVVTVTPVVVVTPTPTGTAVPGGRYTGFLPLVLDSSKS